MTNPTACREQWETAFKEYAQENELSLREYHSHLFGWLAACEWMNTRATEGEEVSIGMVGAMPGTDGFTMACFRSDQVPVGTTLYIHPRAISDEVKRDAVVEKMRKEMMRYLPVLEALAEDPDVWGMATEGTGIATLNGYRHAIDAALAKRGDVR